MFEVLGFVPPLLLAVILHEIAHGWVAEKLGDPTARRLGRITLNPIKHIDPFMTIILPGVLILTHAPFIFGGAKPVPVNPLHFKNPRRGMAYVALAGPAMNLILAALCYVLYLLLVPFLPMIPLPHAALALLFFWILQGIVINIVLALFNLLPVPPLDGGRIAVGFLPVALARRWARLEPFGILIVMGLLFSGLIENVLGPVIDFVGRQLIQ